MTKITSTGSTIGSVKITSTEQTTIVRKITVGTPIRGVVGATTSFDGLSDVVITSVSHNDFIQYDSASGKFVNKSSPVFTSVSSDLIPSTGDTYDLGDSNTHWKNLYLDSAVYLDDGGDQIRIFHELDTLAVKDDNDQYVRFNLSANSTTDLVEGTRLYFTDARSRAAISVTGSGTYDSSTGVINIQGGVTSVNGATGDVVLTTSSFTNDANFLDSTTVTGVINQSYVQANQIKYSTADFTDSAFVTAQINALIDGAPGTLDTLNEIAAALNDDDSAYATLVGLINDQLDSAEVVALIDSDYVQLRQDYAYSSLTGVPTNVSSFTNDANYLDSTTVTGVIDASYVTGLIDTTYLDSAEVIALVDSSYVQDRQIKYTTADFPDSVGVSAIITADVDATFINNLTIDADTLGGNNSSYYLNYNNFTNTPTAVSTFTNDANYLDSTTVTGVIDQTYVTGLIDATYLDSAEAIALIDSDYVQLRQDFAYASLTDAPVGVSAFQNDASYLDAAAATILVDSAYVNQRVDANIDSAALIAVVDSAYVQLRQIKYTTADFPDSVGVSAIITNDVNATFINALTIDADTLGGQNSAYHLNYNNFTNTPTTVSTFTNDANYLDSTTVTGVIDQTYVTGLIDTTYLDSAEVIALVDSDYVEQRQIKYTTADFPDSAGVSSIITADVDAAFINALTIDADTLGGNNSSYYTNAGNLSTGTVDSARLPSLATADIVTGTFDSARLPSLDASDIASGIFDSARIPLLAAADISNGIFDSARIPDLDPAEVRSHISGGTGITYNSTTGEITTTADSHDALSGFVANEHIDHSTVSIVAGKGLTGGGTIAASRTIDIDSANVRGMFSGGTGVTYTSGTGQFAIGQDVGTTDDVTFGKVTGDSFSVGEIAFRTNFHDSHIPFEEGALWYDPHHKNLNYYTDFDHPIEIGMQVIERVYNDNAYTINKGQPLYYKGNRTNEAGQESPTVGLANATSSTKYNVQGLAAEDIPTNSYGQIVVAGVIDGFDTSSLTAGLNFFAGLTDGAVQNAPPTYPNYPMCLGWVIKSDATNGKVIINQQNHSVNSFRVQGDTHISSDLRVDGDLIVAGTQTITSTENVSIGGNIQYLNAGNTIGEAGTTFSGTGLDDAFFAGHYSGDSSTKHFYVEIDATGATDTFEWGFDSTGTPEATGVAITGAEQTLAAGISIDFGATTGHTVGDKWTGKATALNTDTGLFSNKNEGDAGNGYTHVGLYWDATEDEWTFVSAYDSEPAAPINRSHSSFAYGDVRGKNFYGTTFTGALSGNASTATEATNVTSTAITPGTGSLHYITLVDGQGGGAGTRAIKTDNQLYFNPTYNKLTTTCIAVDSADISFFNMSSGTSGSVLSQNASTDFKIEQRASSNSEHIYIDNYSTKGDILLRTWNGSSLDQMIRLEGTTATSTVKLFADGSQKLETSRYGITVTGTVNADSATFTNVSGNGSGLTSLPAGQLTGTIDSARIPGLAAADIVTGTIANARLDAQLQDVAGLATTDGGFIVGNGSNFVLETGSTARASLGLAIGTNVLAYDANLQSFVTAFTLPTSDGNANQVLQTNGSGTLSFVDQTGGGGGGLDSAALTGGTFSNIDVDSADIGNINIGGDIIAGAGAVTLKSGLTTKSVAISNGSTQTIVADGFGSVPVAKLNYNGSERLATDAYGVDVTGRVNADSATIGGVNIIRNSNTKSTIKHTDALTQLIIGDSTGHNTDIHGQYGVNLIHAGSTKLGTSKYGVTVTGTVNADSATFTNVSGNGSGLTSLPAGQLTGTIDSARLPSLATADISNGIFDSARIPAIEIDANRITSGTISDDRLPADITSNINGNAATATEATNVTVTANNSTNETVYLTFVDGATSTQGIETDTALTYNPSSNLLTVGSIDVGGSIVIGSGDTFTLDGSESTLTTVSQTSIASFAYASYGGAKFIVTATQGSKRQITELLVTHDGSTAVATEYGTITTDSDLATFDVSIQGNNVQLLATGTSATSTTYKVVETLIEA